MTHGRTTTRQKPVCSNNGPRARSRSSGPIQQIDAACTCLPCGIAEINTEKVLRPVSRWHFIVVLQSDKVGNRQTQSRVEKCHIRSKVHIPLLRSRVGRPHMTCGRQTWLKHIYCPVPARSYPCSSGSCGFFRRGPHRSILKWIAASRNRKVHIINA
jgi:hypothetical protein